MKSNFEMEVDFGRTIKVTGSYYVGYAVYYKGKLNQPQSQFCGKTLRSLAARQRRIQHGSTMACVVETLHTAPLFPDVNITGNKVSLWLKIPS
ncbi:MAG: hypothetical protein MZV63_08100 [Marinilabiliales bacterium]|nr:hypothetical protein [Marinilabiliales bacterium]